MKVLHVISSGGMYGAEAVILNLSRALNGMDASADGPHRSYLGVFTSKAQPNHELYAAAASNGVEAFPISCQGQFDRTVPASIRALVQRLDIDIVHAHGYKADVYAFFAMPGKHIPLVSTCHTWYDNDLAVRVYGAVDRWILRRFKRVVAVSAEVRERLLRAGVAPRKVHIIANGIDLRPFENTVRQIASEKPLHVGLVGRLAPEKGCDLFIRAAANVLAQKPEAQFVIAGDGPDRASLEALIAELGIGSHVRLLGRCNDMPAFFGSLDILVSASRQEGLPIALLEGMAAGLPLVATRAGEVPSLVVDGLTGTLVPTEDVPALASAILTLLNDPERRRNFGAAARQRIASEYSAQRMTQDYLTLYREALA